MHSPSDPRTHRVPGIDASKRTLEAYRIIPQVAEGLATWSRKRYLLNHVALRNDVHLSRHKFGQTHEGFLRRIGYSIFCNRTAEAELRVREDAGIRGLVVC
jgi:hypothetical protein